MLLFFFFRLFVGGSCVCAVSRRVAWCPAPLHQAEDEIVRLKASEEALDKLMDDYHAHIEKVSRERAANGEEGEGGRARQWHPRSTLTFPSSTRSVPLLFQFSRTEKSLHAVRDEAARVSQECRSLSDELSHKASQSSIDRIVFDNSDEIERIVRSYESKSAHESKVQAAYLSDVRLQLEEMQNYQNQVDQKLQMALKFIDWFTDVKMKHV